MEYKITNVKSFSAETYGRDNNHRAVVNLEGNDAVEGKDYSAFVQTHPSVGDEWEGSIKKTEKGDKIYWNFEFPKGGYKKAGQGFQPAPDANRLEAKIDLVLAGLRTLGGEMTSMKGVLGDILSKVAPANEDPF